MAKVKDWMTTLEKGDMATLETEIGSRLVRIAYIATQWVGIEESEAVFDPLTGEALKLHNEEKAIAISKAPRNSLITRHEAESANWSEVLARELSAHVDRAKIINEAVTDPQSLKVLRIRLRVEYVIRKSIEFTSRKLGIPSDVVELKELQGLEMVRKHYLLKLI